MLRVSPPAPTFTTPPLPYIPTAPAVAVPFAVTVPVIVEVPSMNTPVVLSPAAVTFTFRVLLPLEYIPTASFVTASCPAVPLNVLAVPAFSRYIPTVLFPTVMEQLHHLQLLFYLHQFLQ